MNSNIQKKLFETSFEKTAYLSVCRKYRYTLWRRWREGKSYVQFIGLNPSTADETTDDQTIRRCINFAKAWGFDALCMTNLFAFRATDPNVMKAAADPVGIENDKWLTEIAKDAGIVVAAWGTHGTYLERDIEVKKLLSNKLFCFGKSKNGHPLHPVRLPNNLTPKVFN